MSIVLQGPFLTRAQAAARLGCAPDLLRSRPDLLKLRGTWLQETYFAFQFTSGGLRRDVADVVLAMHGSADDAEIGDWLGRTNPDLGGLSPLAFLGSGGSAAHVIELATSTGPGTNLVASGAGPAGEATVGDPARPTRSRRPQRQHRLAHSF